MHVTLVPGTQVTIAPREKYPLGQTVLKVNEQRERTHMFTRRYLEEQLYTALAGDLPTSRHHRKPPARCSIPGDSQGVLRRCIDCPNAA